MSVRSGPRTAEWWDLDAYAFIEGPCPDTANPSLWRQGQLLIKDGLFEVVPGIYQVRGYDLSIMTLVEGKSGVIVIDPLISKETAAAAFALYTEHRGPRPVSGMIYTHSHLDHFGGVKGVIAEEDVSDGRIPVIAPEGFMQHAVAENVFAGTAMARRAGYMYAASVDKGPKGQIGAGLGQTTSTGEATLIPPTLDITHTGQELTVDGVRVVFQPALATTLSELPRLNERSRRPRPRSRSCGISPTASSQPGWTTLVSGPRCGHCRPAPPSP